MQISLLSMPFAFESGSRAGRVRGLNNSDSAPASVRLLSVGAPALGTGMIDALPASQQPGTKRHHALGGLPNPPKRHAVECVKIGDCAAMHGFLVPGGCQLQIGYDLFLVYVVSSSVAKSRSCRSAATLTTSPISNMMVWSCSGFRESHQTNFANRSKRSRFVDDE